MQYLDQTNTCLSLINFIFFHLLSKTYFFPKRTTKSISIFLKHQKSTIGFILNVKLIFKSVFFQILEKRSQFVNVENIAHIFVGWCTNFAFYFWILSYVPSILMKEVFSFSEMFLSNSLFCLSLEVTYFISDSFELLPVLSFARLVAII